MVTERVITEALAPTVIHIEDDEKWRVQVRKYIERFSEVNFRQFISVSTIEEAQNLLRSIEGPIVLLIDLRLGDKTPNYKGYHWLLEDFNKYADKRSNILVFVISGQMHEGIQETILRRGIPEHHIYDKGVWHAERKRFLAVLRDALMIMGSGSLEDNVLNIPGQNIDPYLTQSFRLTEGEFSTKLTESRNQGDEHSLLPMLIRTKDKNWKPEGIPDLQILGNIDNIFSCRGSKRSVDALAKDKNVQKVEASRHNDLLDCYRSTKFVKANNIHLQMKEKGNESLIGIIDTGIDVLHQAFLDNTGQKSRILAIWDQTDNSGPHPSGFNIGTEHSADAKRYNRERNA